MTASFPFRARSLCGFAVLALVMPLHLIAGERSKARPLAQIFSYRAHDGQTYFALSLRAKAMPATTRRHAHVLLVDTSASQSGEHRKQAYAVVKSFLKSLPKGDRVKVFAVDMEAEPLMTQFASADSLAVRKALAALRHRFPAGATDMLAAMNAAMQTFDGERLASVLYVGDGMSAANLIQSPKMRKLIGVLQQKRIAVHSYAVGARKDLHLLGVLAQQTGGVVQIDTVDDLLDRPAIVGRKLAEACTAPILYPLAISLQPHVQLLPGKPLPMRSDRETIYLGKGVLKGNVQITLTTADRKTRIDQIRRKQFDTGHTYLHALWNRAERSKGLSVSLAGNHLLHAAHDDFTQQVARLERLGERAVATRHLQQAEQIGLTIQKLDPDNVNAKVLLGAANKLTLQRVALLQPKTPPASPLKQEARKRQITFEILEAKVNETVSNARQIATRNPSGAMTILGKSRDAVVAAKGIADIQKQRLLARLQKEMDGLKRLGAAAGKSGDADKLPSAIQKRRIRLQMLESEVKKAIRIARQVAPTNADGAIALLKEQDETVDAENGIDPTGKRQLLRRISSVIQQIRSRKAVNEIKVIRKAERLAQQEAQKSLVEQVQLDKEQIATYIEQIRALIEQGIHGDDDAYEEAESVARVAVDLNPFSGTAAAALFTSEAAGQLNKSFRLRTLRADRFLATLHQVELSHVPFPDEPPVRWPPAEVWQALTERRRKWSSVDLHKDSPAEERIQQELLKTTSVDFVDTTLKEAVEFLAEEHKITIIIDEPALEEEGVKLDDTINRVLAGITLRSALKIILEPMGLTYVVEDEVMKITTIAKADDILTTRVYPVGDLVIPIRTPQSGGLGGGQGGSGGFGGGGGGLGGGGGGFGGGGGGFGGGGGGGLGQFSVPPARINRFRKNNARRALKKKPVGDAELQGVLDRIIGENSVPAKRFQGQAMAQIKDPLLQQTFQLNKKTLEDLKKKRDR